ncbi:hypothetical protein MTR67_019381, partial [Solanum verrucosum]
MVVNTKESLPFVRFPDGVSRESFQELKDRLTSTPVLALPDGSEGYVVYCDASGVGLGCVPMQHAGLTFIRLASPFPPELPELG